MRSLARTAVMVFIGSTPQPTREPPSFRGRTARLRSRAAPPRTRSYRRGQPPAPTSTDVLRIHVALHEPSSPFRAHLPLRACAEAWRYFPFGARTSPTRGARHALMKRQRAVRVRAKV